MTLDSRIILVAGPLIFVLLTAIAGYVYSDIKTLSLPISKALVLFTVFLPLISGLSSRGISALLRQASNNLTLPIAALIWLQIIYETAVATLALTNILPPSALICGLRDQWRDMYNANNGDAIRAIQDKFNCCGFSTTSEMSFPIDHNAKATCAKDFHRTKSCVGPWRQAQQIDAGLLLLVALVVFIFKVFSITSLLTNNSWTRSRWGRPFKAISAPGDEEDDNRATMRGLIEESTVDDSYHDDHNGDAQGSAPEGVNGNDDHGPRVVVSGLAENGNEWRDERPAK